MDKKQIEELAKAAAHSAVIARFSQTTPDEITAVDTFLNAYEYAYRQIAEKQRQAQSEVNMEFGNDISKIL